MSTLSSCTQLLPHRGIIGKSPSIEEQAPSSGRILKFFCAWEQHKRVMGRKAPVMLLYFPADDTIELRQLQPASTPERVLSATHNYMDYSAILKRQRVAKPTYQSSLKPSSGGLRPCRPSEGFYSWEDLIVGKPVAIYGFNLLITHADECTKTFYVTKSSLAIPAEPRADPDGVSCAGATQGTAALLRSQSTNPTCYSNYTHRGTPAMRFQATMVSAPGFECTASDTQRRFMVSFFLEDHTLAIAEPPNSATRTGGPHFFPRQHVLKPCLHSPYSTAGDYAHTDLHIGALLPVLLKARHGYDAEGPKMLQLLAADEWTLDFMASRPQDFPCADAKAVVARLSGELAEGTRAAELAQLLQQDESLTLDEQLASLCVMLVRVGVNAVLHDCVALAREISPHGKVVDKGQLAAMLGLPSAEELSSMTMSGALRSNAMRPRTAYSKQLAQAAMRTWPAATARPQTAPAPSKGRASGKDATTYGATFSTGASHRIGNHVFGLDPSNNPYYNRREHGTHLIRQAITQKSSKLPSWA
eukprot:jgi/Ulvmu1/11085/UM007_0267.1